MFKPEEGGRDRIGAGVVVMPNGNQACGGGVHGDERRD